MTIGDIWGTHALRLIRARVIVGWHLSPIEDPSGRGVGQEICTLKFSDGSTTNHHRCNCNVRWRLTGVYREVPKWRNCRSIGNTRVYPDRGRMEGEWAPSRKRQDFEN